MEDGLRDVKIVIIQKTDKVLILVVMEDGLRGLSGSTNNKSNNSLNPCCYGRWSQRIEELDLDNDPDYYVLILVVMEDGLRVKHYGIFGQTPHRLNPCCYGRWSQSPVVELSELEETVLILVVMEDGLRAPMCSAIVPRSLNPCCYGRWSQSCHWILLYSNKVLILVVMEDGLRVSFVNTESGVYCLNPCCYGRWSQRIIFGIGFALICICVLILVVMEDGLRGVSWQLDRKFKS